MTGQKEIHKKITMSVTMTEWKAGSVLSNTVSGAEKNSSVELCPVEDMLLVRVPRNVQWPQVMQRLESLRLFYPRICCLASGREKKPSWEEFQQYFPDQSIALDGAVVGPSRQDGVRKQMNRGHHGHDSDQGKCTCELLLDDDENGGLSLFERNNSDGSVANREAVTFFDHIDQDGILSLYIFLFGHLIQDPQKREMLHKLVALEGQIDRAAGFCVLPQEDAESLKGVFDHFMTAREKFTWTLDAATMYDIGEMLEKSFREIDQYLEGHVRRLTLETERECIYQGKSFDVVKQIGFEARVGMVQETENREAWVVAIGTKIIDQQERYLYTIKYMKDFCGDLSPSELEDVLNRFESLPVETRSLPLTDQCLLAQHIESQIYFGGHETVIANHQRGSWRNPVEFGQLLSFLTEISKRKAA
jgi:hypothetical protein